MTRRSPRVVITALLLTSACITPLSSAAKADPISDLATITANLTSTQKEIANIEQRMGALREQINKALVDLHDTQAEAEDARQKAAQAKEAFDNTQNDLVDAQAKLDEVARSSYKQGSLTTTATSFSGNAQDSLDRQTYLRTNAQKQQDVVNSLEKIRTEQANNESQLRLAAQEAEQRAKEAQDASTHARQIYESTANQLNELQNQRNELIAQQEIAQAALTPAPLPDSVVPASGSIAEGNSDTTAQHTAGAVNDPLASLNNLATMAAQAATAVGQVNTAIGQTQNIADQVNNLAPVVGGAAGLLVVGAAAAALIGNSQAVHNTFDNPYPSSSTAAPVQTRNSANPTGIDLNELNTTIDGVVGILNTATTTINNLGNGDIGSIVSSIFGAGQSRSAKIETVIARAQSQIGVPYAWGGGDANGPTRGIRDGGVADSYGDYNKIGFDCSGLVLYAFAGVGINLPHYTGYQYQRGSKINPQNMQRGDLIFYGPNAEYHVAIYLGNGQMIEAPQSGDVVKISPVRWSGMSPYAVRLI